MKKISWLILALGLGMMAATGAYLTKVHGHMALSAPGVAVGPGVLYGEHGQVVATECVVLPEKVLDFVGTNVLVADGELGQLPKDTTYGRKLYSNTNGFNVQTSVVLMKTDRTSIHDPHYCLVGGGWRLGKTEKVLVPIDSPSPYNEVPALKVTSTRKYLNQYKLPAERVGLYVYWFVSADRVTSDQTARMWSQARMMIKTGVLERWAYISYFTTCNPGDEEATFKELERFIRASAPKIQTIALQPSTARSPVAKR